MFVSGIISRISRNAMDQCRVLVSSRSQKSSIFACYFQSLRDTSNKMTSIHYSILNGSQGCGFSSSASPRPAEKEEFLKYGGMENVRDRITQEAENPKKFAVRGNFIDAFLLKMKKKRDLINNKKIWSRRSCILPEFVDRSVRIYNGKMFVRCKITEGKVGHKFGEFASTRKRRPMKAKSNTPPAKKGKK